MHLFAHLRTRTRLFVGAILVVLLATLGVQSAGAVSPHLVISQIYGAGGNTNALLNSDYIELFNRGTAPVSLADRSLQYTSAAGTGNFGANSGQLTELPAVTLNPGQYFLVQESSGAIGASLPTPDLVDPTPIAMAAGAGKVALVTDSLSLGCNGGSSPCSVAALARITDLVGYGDTANFFEGGGPAPTISTDLAAFRKGNGCQDTDSNLADFAAAAPAPRNISTAVFECPPDFAPTISARTPDAGATGVPLDGNVTITFSEPVNAVGDWAVVACTATGGHAAAITGGSTTFVLNPNADFAPSETCAVTVVGAQVTDQDTIDPPDRVEGNPFWSFTIGAPPPLTREIFEIQGAAHASPLVGSAVSVVDAIVTAKRSNGYYMQDPTPDADVETSDAIFVFTTSVPAVNVGDSVRVTGTVTEFRPGGASTANLTTTELTSPTTTVLSSGNPLPPTTVIGAGGRVPPTEVIDDDAFANFDAFPSDGIDFYESLEAVRIQVNNPVVVGPRNNNGEIFVLADNGAGAGVRTNRGGIIVRDVDPTPPGDYASGDFNPERIQVDDVVLAGATPNASVGDHFTGPAIGVLDYDFGNFELELTSGLTTVSDGVTREATTAPGPRELSVATFNVENLAGSEAQGKYEALADQIVNSMQSPDVISLEEIQDNNGASNDSVVDASVTLTRLHDAVVAAGGPAYDWRQINPVDDQDGGQPGGNIRVGFFFRTDRGVAFVDRPGGGSTTPTTVVTNPDGKPRLSSSPGRVEPGDMAWNTSRKPLAGEFTYRGETFFLITNHFNSKGGDNPLFGRFQPPVRTTEAQRHQQATLVNAFVDQILAVDPNANVVVLGDLNDFEFSQTMSIVEGGVLHALMKELPQAERYSYVFEGNSQSLDHIVVSDPIFGNPFSYDPVHVNAEFFDQLSDHDPQVARFFVNSAPTAKAGGPYTVSEGGSVGLAATGSDVNGDALAYAWDLDNDGTFETAGQSPTFSAASLDGPSTHTVSVRVSDGDASTTDQATVSVTNVAPTATISAPPSAFAGLPFTVELTNASDLSAADSAAGFQYAFDCGAGYGALGAAASANCVTTVLGPRTVRAKIRDKDSGETAYTATVQVIVTFASLCDLVASYSTDPQVTDQLCHKLQQAAEAPTATGRAGLLSAFRSDVDAKIGKGLTRAQADVLKELSRRL